MATDNLNRNSKRVLSVFSLVMINVIAVDSLRTLPFSAKLGPELIFYYIVCGLFFFLPVALVTAELATTWPKRGGIYAWVKEAFGEKAGFLVVWLLWVYNIVWYPAILGLIAGTLAYMVDPGLANNKHYVLTVVLVTFWASTFGNLFGMKASSWVSTFCSILGTMLPMALITGLAIWWCNSNTPQVSLSVDSIIPKIDSINDLVLLTTIMFGLMGIEMSAVHAQEVKNPESDYPKALKISGLIIIISLVVSSLSVAVVVPRADLNIITGLMQAFYEFCEELNMLWLVYFIASFIIIGAVGGVSAWIIGPTKGLLAAADDNTLPKWMKKTNSKGVPVNILLCQAIVVSILSIAYIYLPTIEAAYLILNELTAILALMMYVILFAAFVRLRTTRKDVKRPYMIPFGKVGMWIVAFFGGGMSFMAMMLGFLPPSQVDVGNVNVYQGCIVIGVILFCLPALFLHKRGKRLQQQSI